MSIQLPSSPFPISKNAKHGGGMPCCVCDRPIKNPTMWLHICKGGGTVLQGKPKNAGYNSVEEDSECESAGCLLYYPIGNCCLKRFPELKPYVMTWFENERRRRV